MRQSSLSSARICPPSSVAANPEGGLLVLILLYTVGLMSTSVVAGRLSDRTGRRKVFVIWSGVIMAVAALLLVAPCTANVLGKFAKSRVARPASQDIEIRRENPATATSCQRGRHAVAME